MVTIAEMLRKVRAVNIVDITGDIMEQHTDELAEYNRKQLMQGKNNKDELLSPKHSENPFFKSRESALRYAGWKHRMNPLAPFDVPDLRINGFYHDSISFSRRADTLTADSNAPFAGKIESTFKNTALGLNQESKETVYAEIIRSPLVHEAANRLGVSVV